MKKNNTKKQVQTTAVVAKQNLSFWEKIEHFFHLKIVTIILLAIISVVFYSNYSVIFDKKINLNGDNIHFFSTGKAIAEGKGYTNTMFLNETPQTGFPPGYPLFIAGLQKIQPNDILFVKRMNGMLLWLSLLLLFGLIKRICNNTLVAFCTTFFVAIQANILSFATMMMSEMLFIFVSLSAIHLALYLNEKLFQKKGRWKSILLLILFLLTVAYVYFIRSIGISLILALAGWFGLLAIFSLFKYLRIKRSAEENSFDTTELQNSRRWMIQQFAICLLIAASFITAQQLWNVRQVKAGQIESTYKKDFYKKLNGQKMETWTDWETRLKINISCNIARYVPATLFLTDYKINTGSTNDTKITSTEWVRGILAFLVMIAGLLFLKKKAFWLIFFYMGIYMVVVILYPEQYQGARYLIPVIPFFLFLFFNGVANITRLLCQLLPQKPNALIPQIIALGVCAFLMYPNSIKAQNELRTTAKLKSWEKSNDTKMTNYLAACKFCKEELPDTVRVIARKPEIYYMFSGYKKSTSFPHYAEPDVVISHLKNTKATHVIIDDWFRHAYVTLYPAVRAYPEKFKVLKEIGKADTTTKQNPTYVLEFNDEWGYHGERVDGKKTGEGYEFFQDGRKYVGHFENNNFHGNGTLYDKNGDVLYKGYWRNGALIRGEGELNYSDGRKYVGEFNNNRPEGYGTLYDAEGKIINKGKWQNGVIINTN